MGGAPHDHARGDEGTGDGQNTSRTGHARNSLRGTAAVSGELSRRRTGLGGTPMLAGRSSVVTG
jgi:hypothetical protein